MPIRWRQLLWRNAFRRIFTGYPRHQILNFDQAYGLQSEAEILVAGSVYEERSLEALQLTRNNGRSACDCEFVALAKRLVIRLLPITEKLLMAFPQYTCSLPLTGTPPLNVAAPG